MNMVAWAIVKLWAQKWGVDNARGMLKKHTIDNAEFLSDEEVEEIFTLMKKLEEL